VTLTPSPLLVPWSRKIRGISLLPLWTVRPVQLLSACTVQLYLYSPQCLYSTAIPLLPLWTVRPVQSLSACTVQLYFYSPYGPHGLYRASVPVQYSYTSTPPMGRTACTEPQCLYSIAIPLLPLWAIRPVQSLSACKRVIFTFAFNVSVVMCLNKQAWIRKISLRRSQDSSKKITDRSTAECLSLLYQLQFKCLPGCYPNI